MAMNHKKVILGGLAAGVVVNVLGYVAFGLMLGPRMNAELDAVIPGASAKMMTGASNIAIGVVGQFVIGYLLAWLYAAMRPRFGPGMRTAVYAALVIWVAGFVFYSPWYQVGTMTGTTYLMGTAVALVLNVAAAAVAGLLYKEEGA